MSEDKQPESTGAARPTGKRQLSGASTTSTKTYSSKRAVATAERPDEDKPGNGVGSFVPEVVSEMKKVVWPTGKEMLQYTLVTFMFLIVLTALVWGVDTLMGLGVEWVLTP